MSPLTIFSPQAIGPVWPAMFVSCAYMAATTVFLVFARLRAWFSQFNLREQRFLQRLYDATEMFSTLAILSGMVGTCLGLLEVLPVLSKTINETTAGNTLQQVLNPLRNVWASTIAGLILGGLWGEVLLFFLKPFTRPVLLPLNEENQPDDASFFSDNEHPSISDETDIDSDEQDPEDDWRKDNHEGMY